LDIPRAFDVASGLPGSLSFQAGKIIVNQFKIEFGMDLFSSFMVICFFSGNGKLRLIRSYVVALVQQAAQDGVIGVVIPDRAFRERIQR
jgi:hypothetical protein